MINAIEGSYKELTSRRIRLDTCKLFGVRAAKINDAWVCASEYRNASGVVAQHVRQVATKHAYWNGPYSGALMFGQHLWQAGGKRLVIAKSETDALTIAQAFSNKWPVVGVPGTEGAAQWVKRNLEWASSFGQVVLAFDATDAGRAAVEEIATLFPPGKARVMDYLGLADASEMATEGAGDKVAQQVFQAKDHRPDGIVMGTELWEDIIAPYPVGLDTPYPILNTSLFGIRKGRIILLTAAPGLGKSTIAHELGHHLMSVHKQKLGVFALEEPRKRLAQRYLAFPLHRPIHLTRGNLSDEQLKEAFDATINTNDFCLYNHRGSKDIASILSKMRYMVVGLDRGWIILDHISIVVSGGDDGSDERKTIDKLLLSLSSMVEELEFGLIAVVHLHRTKGKDFNSGAQVSLNDLRGSAGLEQMAHTIISLERNQHDEERKAISQLRVLKDRDTGYSGPADKLIYSSQTGRLLPYTEEDEPSQFGQQIVTPF